MNTSTGLLHFTIYIFLGFDSACIVGYVGFIVLDNDTVESAFVRNCISCLIQIMGSILTKQMRAIKILGFIVYVSALCTIFLVFLPYIYL